MSDTMLLGVLRAPHNSISKRLDGMEWSMFQQLVGHMQQAADRLEGDTQAMEGMAREIDGLGQRIAELERELARRPLGTDEPDRAGCGMSAETKWTPGPWVAFRGPAYWEVSPKDRTRDMPFTACDVCSFEPGSPDDGLQEANANLIAAAPDLYEALDQAVTSMQDSGYTNGHAAVIAAKSALSKARGAA